MSSIFSEHLNTDFKIHPIKLLQPIYVVPPGHVIMLLLIKKAKRRGFVMKHQLLWVLQSAMVSAALLLSLITWFREEKEVIIQIGVRFAPKTPDRVYQSVMFLI
jgi:hypothetical protein